MDFLRTILAPIIWLMQVGVEALYSITGSYGVSIILLSICVTIITLPLAKIGSNIEKKNRALVNAMADDLAAIKSNYKGEKQFNKIEALYKTNNYHPIKSMLAATGFLISIPFLLSSMLLFLDYPPLHDQSFLFIQDLSNPDQMISFKAFGLNVMPMIMTGIALFDSHIKPDMSVADRLRFLIISAVLFLLVYPLPAAIILYWACNNLWSTLLTLRAKRRDTRPTQ